eukprot:1155751-Pelagomonas_calceolata.AAC.3
MHSFAEIRSACLQVVASKLFQYIRAWRARQGKFHTNYFGKSVMRGMAVILVTRTSSPQHDVAISLLQAALLMCCESTGGLIKVAEAEKQLQRPLNEENRRFDTFPHSGKGCVAVYCCLCPCQIIYCIKSVKRHDGLVSFKVPANPSRKISLSGT